MKDDKTKDRLDSESTATRQKGSLSLCPDSAGSLPAECADSLFFKYMHTAPFGIAFLSADGSFVYMSPRFCDMLACDPPSVPDFEAWLRELIAHDDRRQEMRELWQTCTSRSHESEAFPFVFPLPGKDGAEKRVALSFRSVGLGYASITAEDITEQHKKEEAGRTAEARVRSFIENVDDMVYFQGLDGSLAMLNSANAKITGYSLEEFESNPQLWREIVHPEDVKIAEEFFAAHPEGVPFFEIEYRLRTKHGEERWIHSRMVAAHDADNKMIGYYVVDRDITTMKKAQETLRNTEKIRALGEMAGGVAHNFNNVLQVIMSCAQMALSDVQNGCRDEAADHLEEIVKSASLGAQTIARLHDYSRLHSQSSEHKGRTFDLSTVAAQAVEMSKPWWKTKPEREGIRISVETSFEPGCTILGQENEMFEVVLNLVKNACEALPTGGSIRVSTSSEGRNVILKVSDNGTGIADDYVNRVFEPFFTTKGSGGTGMGLATCSAIVQLHGGRISLSPDSPEGASFVVQLPAADAADTEASPSTKDSAADSLRLLLIDDAESVLKMLRKGLEILGQEVVAVNEPEQGLRIFSEMRFDAVVCDLGMPSLNGMQVAAAIAETARSRGSSPPLFILLTGWGKHAISNLRAGGGDIDCILEKPVDVRSLLETIRRLLAHRRGENQPD